MPVPVASTHAEGKGLSAHQNRDLPSTGSLFSRLNAESANRAMDSKQAEQAVPWKDRQAPKHASTSDRDVDAYTGDTPASGPAVVCRRLKFHYVGDNGLAAPGALDRAAPART